MNLIEQLQQQADIICDKSAFYKGIEIKQLTVNQYFEILPLINAIQIEGEVNRDTIHELVPAQIMKFKNNINDIFKIVFNKELKEFKDLIPLDLYNLIGIINMQMDHGSFTRAITSISALSKTSTVDLIANQERIQKQREQRSLTQ